MPINRDKSALYPPFAATLDTFENALSIAGLPFYFFEGMRSPERQLELWNQGRTTPGIIVTNALPFSSLHFYGFAADYVLDGMLDRPGIQWSWDARAQNAPMWREMARIARNCGIEAGFFWNKDRDGMGPDLPHLQIKYGFTITMLRRLILDHTIAQIWEMADAWLFARSEKSGG